MSDEEHSIRYQTGLVLVGPSRGCVCCVGDQVTPLEAGARAIHVNDKTSSFIVPWDEMGDMGRELYSRSARAAAIAMVGALTHEAIDRIEDATVGATYVEGFRAELVKQLTGDK